MGIVGMMMLFYTSLPFNRMRKILFVTMGTAFLLCAVFLSSFFSLVPLSFQGWLILAVFAALSVPTYMAVHRVVIALGNAFSVLQPEDCRRKGCVIRAAYPYPVRKCLMRF